MQDRRDSRKGDEGCWKWQMQDRRKQESRDAGKTDAELVGCRPEGMQDRSRVSQFRFKKSFASKRNLAKQKQFRFVSLQFRETTKQKFRFVSLCFAS